MLSSRPSSRILSARAGRAADPLRALGGVDATGVRPQEGAQAPPRKRPGREGQPPAVPHGDRPPVLLDTSVCSSLAMARAQNSQENSPTLSLENSRYHSAPTRHRLPQSALEVNAALTVSLGHLRSNTEELGRTQPLLESLKLDAVKPSFTQLGFQFFGGKTTRNHRLPMVPRLPFATTASRWRECGEKRARAPPGSPRWRHPSEGEPPAPPRWALAADIARGTAALRPHRRWQLPPPVPPSSPGLGHHLQTGTR